MSGKNYYKILQLPPTASHSDIRKAYRKLAMIYHPDKNRDPSAESRFKEIQEAYFHLADAHRRSVYDQKHWFSKQQSAAYPKEPLTALNVHLKTKKLGEYLKRIHRSDIDKQALADYLHHLINPETTAMIANTADDHLKKELIHNILNASGYISRPELEKVAVSVKIIAGNTGEMRTWVESTIAEARLNNCYQRFKPWIILAIAILLCIFIYLAAR